MSAQEQSSYIREVCVFCLMKQGRCFKDWSGDKIFRYIAWHWLNGTLFVVRDSTQAINGVAIAWRVKQEKLFHNDKENIPQFDWSKLDDDGDSTLLCDAFGDRQSCNHIARMVFEKWPESNRQPVFTYRNNELVEFPLNRFIQKGKT